MLEPTFLDDLVGWLKQLKNHDADKGTLIEFRDSETQAKLIPDEIHLEPNKVVFTLTSKSL